MFNPIKIVKAIYEYHDDLGWPRAKRVAQMAGPIMEHDKILTEEKSRLVARDPDKYFPSTSLPYPYPFSTVADGMLRVEHDAVESLETSSDNFFWKKANADITDTWRQYYTIQHITLNRTLDTFRKNGLGFIEKPIRALDDFIISTHAIVTGDMHRLNGYHNARKRLQTP